MSSPSGIKKRSVVPKGKAGAYMVFMVRSVDSSMEFEEVEFPEVPVLPTSSPESHDMSVYDLPI